MSHAILQHESQPDSPVPPRILRRETPVWKRAIDLLGVAVVTPVVTPVMVAVAAYIKLISPGPVLFVQSRVGFGGDEFRIYKFRTMHVPTVSRDQTHRDYVASRASDDQPLRKPDYRNDLIPGGEFLRKLSIDELPQLMNVLQGNMSLVGPRPDVLRIHDYEAEQLRRFEVLPGITGLWQVSGKNRLTLEQMIDLDIEYVDTRSFWRDVKILAKTVRVLVLDRNE